jgi:hypothetical protein
MPRPTAVSFVSDRFDLTWPAGADPNSSPPWGKDCAEFIAEKLPRHGILVPTEEPEEEDGGWYFRVEINTSKLMVSVNWWPVGSKPERNIWVVQVRPWPSLLPAFLGKTSDQACKRSVTPSTES